MKRKLEPNNLSELSRRHIIAESAFRQSRDRQGAVATANTAVPLEDILGDGQAALLEVQTSADGPRGSLPLTADMLNEWPSGDLFGLTQNAGMGWSTLEMLGPQF